LRLRLRLCFRRRLADQAAANDGTLAYADRTGDCHRFRGGHLWPLSPAVLAATAIGSLAPDIDHPQSTLGRPLFFVSYPMNATIGHRTGTHSFLALAFCTLAVLIAEAASYANIGYGFLVGYVAHIAADLLTIEGCALLYPTDREMSGTRAVRSSPRA
jgi:membrane-bound metal-dependent hydrolase YbcI (DUF457 family)